MYQLDQAESIFLGRQLEYVLKKTYDKKYPELLARKFVPVSNETPPGAENITYEQWDRVGRAAVIGKGGSVDLPRVQVFSKEFTRPVIGIGDSYGWNLKEIRSAMYAGKPLDSKLASAARRAFEELVDEIASVGAPDYGIPTGFINDPGVEIDASANWGTLEGDEIIEVVRAIWYAVWADTKDVEKPNGIILPVEQYGEINKPRATGTDTSVRKWLLENLDGLEFIDRWYRLEGAGESDKDRGIVYRRDPDHVQQQIPNEFEQLPLSQQGINFNVDCIGATAGTQWFFPRSARYFDIALPAP